MARHCLVAGLLAASILSSVPLHAVEIEDLKAEVDRIREELKREDAPKADPVSTVDNTIFEKYGPGAKATTKNGILTVGGLLQVWYQHIENDGKGIIRPTAGNILVPIPIPGATDPVAEANRALDNDTFRVRRAEMRFTLDINESVTAFIMIDPSREANVTFSPIPANPNHNSNFNNPHLKDGSGQKLSNSIVPQLVQDAVVVFHDLKFLPRHDFYIGQMKPPSGEEAWRSSGLLDFVDRSMVTAVNNVRDIGVMAHGGWVDAIPDDPSSARFQYWLGIFNGPDGTVLTDPEIVEGGNRSDDNQDKDFCFRLLGQPVWDAKKWYGRLETGIARTDGYRGKSGHAFNTALQINSVNKERTAINRSAAWIWYRPGGPTIGWWLRGEWSSAHDRYSNRAATSLLGVGQTNPAPVSASGWYFATGYKLSQSTWVPKLDKMIDCKTDSVTRLFGKALKNSEITFRYEAFENVATENPANTDVRTNLFKTTACTYGYNYYIDFYKTRLQANYVVVRDPVEPLRGLREVHNNMFVINFQVQY